MATSEVYDKIKIKQNVFIYKKICFVIKMCFFIGIHFGIFVP